MVNIFLYGMSGSGKDTLANYFKNSHLYLKFRCAGTIKQIISEKSNMTFSELEERKRTEKELREAHWKVGDWMGKDGAAVSQRIKNILSRKSVEFDILPSNVIENPICFCDVRRMFEVELMLQNGCVGIFLTRTTPEYKHGKHSTEDSIMLDDRFDYILNKYKNQCIVVFNNGESPEYVMQIIDTRPSLRNALGILTFKIKPDGKSLINTFKQNIESIIPMFFDKNESQPLML